MVEILKDSDENIIGYRFNHKSWFKPRPFSKRELLYFDLIQTIFKIQLPNGDWVNIDLQQHQCEYHRDDIACKGSKAPIRVVIKARNTSFTVDSIISENMAVSEYKNQIVPLFRYNKERSFDFIEEFKQHVKHMTPIVFEENGKKLFIPFDVSKVNLQKVGNIKYPDGTEFRAFAAKGDSAEAIRGVRFRGNAGIIDEANFMRYFKDIYQAMEDATAGSHNGEEHFQFSVGTTLKGLTPFYTFLDNLMKKRPKNIKLYEFPIFDKELFESEGYFEKEPEDCVPFHLNDKLVSLVFWHDKEKLWDKYSFNKQKFLEEYMAYKVDGDYQFYKTNLLQEILIRPKQELNTIDFKQYHKIRMGVDVATSSDYFSFSVFGYDGFKWHELYLVNKTNVELDVMQAETEILIEHILSQNSDFLCSIDSVGIGIHITQNLRRQFPEYVRGVNGGQSVKYGKKLSIKLNHFLHTNMKKMMLAKTVEMIDDELHFNHFLSVMSDFKIEKNEYGHGDSVMSAGYALLPDVLAVEVKQDVNTNLEEEITNDESTLLDKISYYRSIKSKKKRINL